MIRCNKFSVTEWPAPRQRRAKAAKKNGAGNPRESFRKFFHAEADDDVGVAEDYTHGVPQVLRLMNSVQTNNTAALTAKLIEGRRACEGD